jgi:prophage regulatory protein
MVPPMAMDRIVRMPELRAVTGLSSATIYRLIAKGAFPQAVVLGANSRGWRASAVASWLDGLEDAGPLSAAAAPEPEGAAPRRGRAVSRRTTP